MATGINLLSLASAMDNADYVLVDGVVFATEYMRVPDEATTADDIVIEAKHGDDEIMFTRGEIDDAEHHRRGRLSAQVGRGTAVPVERDDPLRPRPPAM